MLCLWGLGLLLNYRLIKWDISLSRRWQWPVCPHLCLQVRFFPLLLLIIDLSLISRAPTETKPCLKWEMNRKHTLVQEVTRSYDTHTRTHTAAAKSLCFHFSKSFASSFFFCSKLNDAQLHSRGRSTKYLSPFPPSACRPLWRAASGRLYGVLGPRWRQPRQCLQKHFMTSKPHQLHPNCRTVTIKHSEFSLCYTMFWDAESSTNAATLEMRQHTAVCQRRHRNHLFTIELKLESGEDDYAGKPEQHQHSKPNIPWQRKGIVTHSRMFFCVCHVHTC